MKSRRQWLGRTDATSRPHCRQAPRRIVLAILSSCHILKPATSTRGHITRQSLVQPHQPCSANTSSRLPHIHCYRGFWSVSNTARLLTAPGANIYLSRLPHLRSLHYKPASATVTPHSATSRRKPKVQPLIPSVLRRRQIAKPLRLAHLSPHLVLLLIPPNIIRLCRQVHNDIEPHSRQQHGIPALVRRRVVLAVDIRRDDAASLRHVSSGDGTTEHKGSTYPCTHMLYMAAPTARLRTALALRETQPTWMGWA